MAKIFFLCAAFVVAQSITEIKCMALKDKQSKIVAKAGDDKVQVDDVDTDLRNINNDYKSGFANLKVIYQPNNIVVGPNINSSNYDKKKFDITQYLVNRCQGTLKTLEIIGLGNGQDFGILLKHTNQPRFAGVTRLDIQNSKIPDNTSLSVVFPNVEYLKISRTELICEALLGLNKLKELTVDFAPGHFFSRNKQIVALDNLVEFNINFDSEVDKLVPLFPMTFNKLKIFNISSKNKIIDLINQVLDKTKKLEELTILTKDTIPIDDLTSYIEKTPKLVKLVGVKVDKCAKQKVIDFDKKFKKVKTLALQVEYLGENCAEKCFDKIDGKIQVGGDSCSTSNSFKSKIQKYSNIIRRNSKSSLSSSAS